MFDALRNLWARLDIWEWIMNHRLKFGTAAACILAVPLSISVFYATSGGRMHMFSGPDAMTAAEETVRSGKDSVLRLFGGVGADEQTPVATTVPTTEVPRQDRKEVAALPAGHENKPPSPPAETEAFADGDRPSPKVEVGRPQTLQPQGFQPQPTQSADGNDRRKQDLVDAEIDHTAKPPAPAARSTSNNVAGLRSRQLMEKRKSYQAQSLSDDRMRMALKPAPVAGEKDAMVAPVAAPEPEPAVSLQQPADKTFESVASNPLKIVADEPVSTFSIDVDTASYAHVRRALKQGVMPVPASVRVEEMINYFSYDYPLPDDLEVPFRTNVAVYPTPWNKDTKLLHIGIKGTDIVPAARPRANLVFLIDTSGSMNGRDRLPLLQTAFRLLVQELDENDTVSIVTYAGNAGTVLEPTKASNRRRIINAITNLRPGGSTAGAAGIRQAYALAEQVFDKNGVNRVILATDGDFNVGMTSKEQLKGYIAEKRKSGVFLSVLGFGQGNYNDSLMQTLAQNGNGNAAYIDSLKEAEKVLVTEATSTLFPIAKDVKIQIEFNPASVSAYRLIGYETRMLRRQDFNNDRIDAGDIGSGHTVTALYEITPTDSAAKPVDDLRYQPAKKTEAIAPSNEFAFLKLRYKKPNGSTSKLIEQPITTALEQTSMDGLSNDVRFAAAVAAFGQKLRRNTHTEGMTFEQILDLATSARGHDRFGFRAEFVDLVRMAKLLTPVPSDATSTQRQ